MNLICLLLQVVTVEPIAQVFYAEGPLHEVAASYCGTTVSNLPMIDDLTHERLSRWVEGLEVMAPLPGSLQPLLHGYVIQVNQIFSDLMLGRSSRTERQLLSQDISKKSAQTLAFTDELDREICKSGEGIINPVSLHNLAAVVKFFLQHNHRLKHPHLPCVQLTPGMWWPLELIKVARNVTLDAAAHLTEQQASSGYLPVTRTGTFGSPRNSLEGRSWGAQSTDSLRMEVPCASRV